MPNKLCLGYLTFILFLNCVLLSAQTLNESAEKQTITKVFERYFERERESIHVQLDKNIFMTNESIWFKGYVYNKNLNLPFYATTNVYVQLIDESGKIITNELLYCMSGFFSGKIKLNKQLPSGYYYLQYYTNWMNNFSEDESFVQRVMIKNTADYDFPVSAAINPVRIDAVFYPEGGQLISAVPNNIGVKLTDVNGKAVPNCVLEIVDANNAVQKRIATNAFGMAKFEWIPNNQNYKATLTYGNKKFEFTLPTAQSDGICLEANNYVLDDKTLIRIKYNKDYAKNIQQKALYLIIQKNEKTNIIDFRLKADEGVTMLAFSNNLLFDGVNSLRIIDSELNEIAHRLVYSHSPQNNLGSVGQGLKNNERIELSASTNWYDACVGVTTLPSGTKISMDDNIFTSLKLNAYLKEKLVLPHTYFKNPDRTKKYELDLMMLTQKGDKYEWSAIKRNNETTTAYAFENGLEIKGYINSTKADLKKCRIQLMNLLGEVITSTETIENNAFYFKKAIVTDSIKVSCNLIDKKDRSKNTMNYQLTVLNKNKKFNKNYLPVAYQYPTDSEGKRITEETTFFNISDGIVLKEVEVKKVKTKLRRKDDFENSYLKGFQVGTDVTPNTVVLDFIEQNGFNVNRYGNAISITGRTRNSILGVQNTTPLVFLDNMPLMDLEILRGMIMDELDEIYISSNTIIASMNNNQGMIKMYRRKPELLATDPNNKPKLLLGGFKLITPFENAAYDSLHSKGFENFGLIHWSPWILTDEKGNLKTVIPNTGHKSVKLIIEGITLSGNLISETKEIDIE